jgi:hypothetical protein
VVLRAVSRLWWCRESYFLYARAGHALSGRQSFCPLYSSELLYPTYFHCGPACPMLYIACLSQKTPPHSACQENLTLAMLTRQLCTATQSPTPAPVVMAYLSPGPLQEGVIPGAALGGCAGAPRQHGLFRRQLLLHTGVTGQEVCPTLQVGLALTSCALQSSVIGCHMHAQDGLAHCSRWLV